MQPTQLLNTLLLEFKRQCFLEPLDLKKIDQVLETIADLWFHLEELEAASTDPLESHDASYKMAGENLGEVSENIGVPIGVPHGDVHLSLSSFMIEVLEMPLRPMDRFHITSKIIELGLADQEAEVSSISDLELVCQKLTKTLCREPVWNSLGASIERSLKDINEIQIDQNAQEEDLESVNEEAILLINLQNEEAPTGISETSSLSDMWQVQEKVPSVILSRMDYRKLELEAERKTQVKMITEQMPPISKMDLTLSHDHKQALKGSGRHLEEIEHYISILQEHAGEWSMDLNQKKDLFSRPQLSIFSLLKSVTLQTVEEKVMVLKKLLELGVNVNQKAFAGGTYGSQLIAGYLIEHQQVNFLKEIFSQHQTLIDLSHGDSLHTAVGCRNIEAVKMLLDQGMNINAESNDYFREPALVTASRRANTEEVLKLLIEKGASLSEQDREGNTALHQASFHGFFESVSALLNAGADQSMLNNKGKTPLEYAKEGGQGDVVAHLEGIATALKEQEELGSLLEVPVSDVKSKSRRL